MYLVKKIGWLFLELVLFSVIFILLIAAQFYLLKLIGVNDGIWNADNLSESSNPFLLISSFLPVLIAFTVAAIVTYHLIMKHPYSDLGILNDKAFTLFARGFLFSSILIIPGFILLYLTGQIKLLSVTFNASFFLGFFIFFFIQSTAEEIFTRAFLIPTFEGRVGTWIAILVSASLFGIMHIGNDNFTWVGFFNIMLGGLIMALLFIYYRNIWICAGFHTGWNFIQASFFDFNVSGVDVYSLIQFQDTGYSNISGGSFGYEGSLISILALIITLVVMNKKMNFSFKPFIWKQPIVEINEAQLAEDVSDGFNHEIQPGSDTESV